MRRKTITMRLDNEGQLRFWYRDKPYDSIQYVDGYHAGTGVISIEGDRPALKDTVWRPEALDIEENRGTFHRRHQATRTGFVMQLDEVAAALADKRAKAATVNDYVPQSWAIDLNISRPPADMSLLCLAIPSEERAAFVRMIHDLGTTIPDWLSARLAEHEAS